jgi:hypothetical protein
MRPDSAWRKLGRTILAMMLLPVIVTAGTPQVWFCPLDSYFRQSVGYGGSPQYMSLFTPDAPWSKAAAHTNVFKFYSQWIHQASDADLRAEFADLNRRGIALALEAGALTASSECGRGVEGQGGEGLLKLALRIKQNGGILRYVAMDEPIFFWTLYTGKNACHETVDQMVANAAVNLRALRAQFPDTLIGDIEPLPVSAPNWLPQYQAGVEAFRKALGFPLAFFDADILWDSPTYLADLAAARKMAASEGVPFGIIYNGDGFEQSDAGWVQSATRHMAAVESHLGSPDLAIFQSWHAYPKKLLPETDSDSFTSLIDGYFRRRTALTTSIKGSALHGRLVAADTGRGIAHASVELVLSPTAGKGTPIEYVVAGNVPPGTESIVFGARVNQECTCSGTADFLVSSFTLDAGASGVVTRDFSNQLKGWGVSATGARVEGGSLHIAVRPDQSVQLNSAHVPFTAPVPYTFRVKAQVAPESSGSGYFALVFLNSAKEISRVKIPLAAATRSLGRVTTDASGRYAFPLRAEGTEPFQVQSSYAGSGDNWPAQSISRKGP